MIMDIITLDRTTYDNGRIVNGLTSKLWVERYLTPGEFKLLGPPTDDIRDRLAIGTLVTHTDTLEVMMVEDHEINETSEDGAVLTVTGRGLDSFLESRVIANDTYGVVDPLTDRSVLNEVPAGSISTHLHYLLNAILVAGDIDPMDIIPTLGIGTGGSLTGDPAVARVLMRERLDETVLSLLSAVDGGIAVERPNRDEPNLLFRVHKGLDLRSMVHFSWASGDLTRARYFWSNRAYRNGAVVCGKYHIKIMRPVGLTGLDVRMMLVDAQDIDIAPDGTPETLAYLEEVLEQRGLAALSEQSDTLLMEATVTDSAENTYRVDYNMGDLVHVTGNYGLSAAMRITEYVETEDANGISGFPTLSTPKG